MTYCRDCCSFTVAKKKHHENQVNADRFGDVNSIAWQQSVKSVLTILFNIILVAFLVFSSFWVTGYYVIVWKKEDRHGVFMTTKEGFYFGLITGLIVVLDILIIRRFVRLILKRYRR